MSADSSMATLKSGAETDVSQESATVFQTGWEKGGKGGEGGVLGPATRWEMASAAVLAARAAGIQLDVDGDDLVLGAAAPPSPAILERLSHHKAAILAWIRPCADGWAAEDWQVFFDERAGIAEFDGGLPRDEAEAQAFSCCVTAWLNRNPVSSPEQQCLICGDRDHAQTDPTASAMVDSAIGTPSRA